MNRFYFLRIYLSIHLLFLSINSQVINLHSDASHQGVKHNASISQCSNLAEGMAREVTSVDTKGHCAAFYDGRDCTGNFIEVLPHSPTHYNLHFWGFNDKALSVGPCADPCDEKITGKDKPDGADLLIYNRKDFKGAYEELKVKGCTLIPTKFVRQLLSVKTFDHCMQFYNNVECKASGAWADTIELRKGTPFHSDITSWHFPEARAVAQCSFKCDTSALEAVKSVQKAYPTAPEEVFVFDQKDFKGNQLNLKLDGCTTFENHWEGAALSLKTFNGSCVVIFDKRGCTGDSINILGEHSDLSGRSFDGVARSIAPCLKTVIQATPIQREEFGGRPVKSSVNSSLSPLVLAVIIVVPLLGVILSVALVFLIMRRCNPYKNIVEMLSEKEIEEFINGLGMELGPVQAEASASNEDYSVELLAQNKPYNESFEIPRANVKFDTKMPLGMGEFGVVYKGTVQLLTEDEDEASQEIKAVPVAVKTVRPNSNAHCLRSLLKEVKVMLFVGKHSNIVQMVGCCTENLRKGEVLILMEFCPRGSLESFLQKNRSSFVNFVTKGRLTKDVVVNVDSDYRNMEEVGNYANLDVKIPPNFDFFQLLQWCIEICSGMEFLSSRKVVHSDLAARNVLLDGGFRAKISDFGLSKQLYCYTQYVKKKQEPLPWRWLAIESLKSMEFSSKSDVWGWGILAWEIFTLGEKPYPGVVWSEGFIRNLEEGLRLGKPKYAVTECYNLMLQCWSDEPETRPTFSELLADLIELSTSLRSLYCNGIGGGSNIPVGSQPYVTYAEF